MNKFFARLPHKERHLALILTGLAILTVFLALGLAPGGVFNPPPPPTDADQEAEKKWAAALKKICKEKPQSGYCRMVDPESGNGPGTTQQSIQE